MTDLSLPRPPATARAALVRLLLALCVLAAVAAAAWTTSDSLRFRLVGDDSVSFTGTFPEPPGRTAAVYEVAAARVSLTRGAMVEHFGFPADQVYRQEPGDGSVVFTTWRPGEEPVGPLRRFIYTSGVPGSPPLMEFHHRAAQPPVSARWTSVWPPKRVRESAEATVRRALAGLGLAPEAWSVTARTTYLPSGELSLLVQPLLETGHGPLPVGAAASGWAVTGRDGRLVAMSIAPLTFTETAPVGVMSAEEAWDRYVHHRADETPTGAAVSYTDVELAMAVFVDGDRAGVESLARPAWVFRADWIDPLVLSADASAPGRVGEVVIPGGAP